MLSSLDAEEDLPMEKFKLGLVAAVKERSIAERSVESTGLAEAAAELGSVETVGLEPKGAKAFAVLAVLETLELALAPLIPSFFGEE